jgi:hypothetical protein
MPHETEDTVPLAKRTGREDARPRNQPAEFADDMATNRFPENPPPAAERGEGEDESNP